MRNQIALVCLVVAIVAAGRHFRQGSYITDREEFSRKTLSRQKNAVQALWNQAGYVPVSSVELRERVQRQVALPSLNLDSRQREKLETVAFAFLDYVSAPSFERFVLLKTQGVSYSFGINSGLQRRIEAKKRQGVYFPSEPRERSRACWQAFHGTGFSGEPAKVLGIATTNVNISVELRPPGKGSMAVAEGLRGAKLFRHSTNPGAFVDNSAMSLPGVTNTFAVVAFWASVNCSTNSGPICVEFRWLADRQAWLPEALVSASDMLFECCL